MKVSELIAKLQQCDVDTEVQLDVWINVVNIKIGIPMNIHNTYTDDKTNIVYIVPGSSSQTPKVVKAKDLTGTNFKIEERKKARASMKRAKEYIANLPKDKREEYERALKRFGLKDNA